MRSQLLLLTILVTLSASFAQRPNFMDYYNSKNSFMQPQQASTDSQANAMNFARGFLNAISPDPIFDNVKECIIDSEVVMNDLRLAFLDIKTMKPEEVKAGIERIGKAARFIPTAAILCKDANADVAKIFMMIESFKSPHEFFFFVKKSIIINRVEVFYEIGHAMVANDNHDYYQVGYWIGKAMETIFLKQFDKSTLNTNQDILNFAKGFFEGVGSASAFDQVRVCIADSENFGKDISQGIADIKTKNPAKVKEGIALLGHAAHTLPDAVRDCQAAGLDLQRLYKMVTAFENPTAFLYYVGKSLLINRVEVMKEVLHAVSAYEAKDYEQLGYWIGKAMDTIVLGEHQTLSQDFVDHLNKVSGWKAAIPSKFEGMTYEEIKNQFLGALTVDYSQIENITVFDYEGMENDLPTHFNASEQWPGCVHPIRDQGHCGSCWAFAASESLSDRFCIASQGKINVVLSPQYLLSCNNVMNHGCNGGIPLYSWWFITKDGLVSDACLPYASYNGTQPITCKSVTTCADGSQMKKYYGVKDSTVQLKNPTSIQANLFKYGPVEAAFTVYQDFMYYKGGIYTHTSGGVLGGHAVKIIGWGQENGTNYWIVANSWGPSWGENGFFRIAFGQCGIDAAVVVAQADIDRAMRSENNYEQFLEMINV